MEIGDVFNRLTVLDILSHGKIKCKCVCGIIKDIDKYKMQSGHTQSCGCQRKENFPPNRKHKLSRTPLYRIWRSMREKCYRKTHGSYENVGGRGIKICEEWDKDYVIFQEWAISNGWKKGLCLIRKNHTLDFCPENCKIVTSEENHSRPQNRKVIIKEDVPIKTCTRCKMNKPNEDFPKNRNTCKKCQCEYSKNYANNNKEKVSERVKIYQQNNREVLNKKQCEYVKNRKNIDPMFKLKKAIRGLLGVSFKTKRFTKNSRSYQILGCSYEEFKNYIEDQFEGWMSWDNYGKTTGKPKETWNFDHKIPISSVSSEEDIIRLNHYTNFQPLCSYINSCIKGDKLDFKKENEE